MLVLDRLDGLCDIFQLAQTTFERRERRDSGFLIRVESRLGLFHVRSESLLLIARKGGELI